MSKLFPVLLLLVFGLLSLIAPQAVCADDNAAQTEPEGVITECEALWREEIPRFLEMEPRNDLFVGPVMRWTDVAVAPDGSTYLLCNFASNENNTSKVQAILVKYDDEGERAWYRTIDDGLMDQGHGVEVGPEGNVYVVGYSQRLQRNRQIEMVGYVTSYNARGRHRWTYVEDESEGANYFALAFHGDSVYAVGWTVGRVGPRPRFDHRQSDMLVTRIRLNGRHLWSRQYQGEAEHWASSAIGVTATPSGRICVTGWQTYMTQGRTDTNPSDSDCIVLCVDGDGDQVWRERVGEEDVPLGRVRGTIGSLGMDIDSDADGNLYVLGGTHAESDAAPEDVLADLGSFVIKISEQGEIEWQRYCPNTSTSTWTRVQPHRIEVDQEGRVWVAGDVHFRNQDYVGVLQYSGEGDLANAWRLRSEGSDYDTCHATVFDASQGSLVATGVSNQNNPAKSPHYFVMRIPLLDGSTDDESAEADGGR